MEKKYFWIQMKDNFFRQKEILKLRSIAGGDTFTIIYLEMILLSLPNGGKIFFDGIEETPEKEIALTINEKPDDVAVTVNILRQMGLLKDNEEGDFILSQFSLLTGSETASAVRMRRYRENQKTIKNRNNVTPALRTSDESVTTDIDIDKEIDIHLQKEKEINHPDIDKEKPKTEELSSSGNEIEELDQEIGTAVTQLLGGIGSTQYFQIMEMQKVHEKKWILEAIRISREKGVKKLPYVEAILRDWEKNGYPKNQTGSPGHHGRFEKEKPIDWSKVEARL